MEGNTMKKSWIILAVAFGLFFTSTMAMAASDLSKAKDFLKANMYPQATALLEKIIDKTPTVAEAHFLLGQCYSRKENFQAADERFSSAVGLDPALGYKIASIYQDLGLGMIRRNNIESASRMFDKAVEYQPKRRKEFCKNCFDLGNKETDSTSFGYYTITSQLCLDYNQAIGKRLVSLANSQNAAEERERFMSFASRFITIEVIEKLPDPSPGWKVEGTNLVACLNNGENSERVFDLAEGESTPAFIIPIRKDETYDINMKQEGNVVVDDGSRKVIVLQGQNYSLGTLNTDKIFLKFTALKGGAKITFLLSRND